MTPDEEYPIFIDHVNRLTDRRQTVTITYLSVNAALVGAVAFLFKDGYLPNWSQQISALVLFAAGIVACDLWRRLLWQYRNQIEWWYRQIHILEDDMETSSKLVQREYNNLYTERKGQPRHGPSLYEIRLTWVFTGIYASFGVAMLVLLAANMR